MLLESALPMNATTSHDPDRPRRLAILVLAVALGMFNAYALTRPMWHQPGDVLEWRKGPLIKDYSPYASANSARIFWPVAAGMVDAYALLMFLYRRRTRGRRSASREVAVSAAALLLVIGAGELASRGVVQRWWYLQYRPDPELYWYNRPGLADHTDATDSAPRTTNSRGFRMTREIADLRPADEYRILAFGDSSTFGLGVPDQDAYLAVLERHWRHAPTGT